MLRKSLFNALAVLVVLSVVLTACGGGGGDTSAEPASDGPKTTSSGFECPEPNPRVDVTSTELNIFVWTEYFPQDMLDCFEMVYGITLNRDEYSSNEEMYAKVSAGAPLTISFSLLTISFRS
ncbi:MAG: hypothetical protein IPJ47_03860 [Anaerolineales bacterium]|nr:hypothetical protein [Anaerolineales bacterium]